MASSFSEFDEETRGHREAQLSDSWDRNAGGGRSNPGAGSAGKTGAEKSSGSWCRRRRRSARQGSVRKEMRHVPFRGQRCEENRTRPQRNLQARNVHSERQQSHYGITDDVDRERRLPDAQHERDARTRSDQRRRCLRENTLSQSQKRKAPESLIAQAAGGPNSDKAAPTSGWRL